MPGVQLSTEEAEKVLKIINLEEREQKVYLGLLTLGSGTLGEIAAISGIDVLHTRKILDELEKQKFVASVVTEAKISRFFAQEPFLKAFYTAFDSLILVNMKKRIQEKLEKEQKLIEETSMFKQFLQKKLEDKKTEYLGKTNDLIREEIGEAFDEIIEEVLKLNILNLENKNKRITKALRSINKDVETSINMLIANIKETRQKLKLISDISQNISLPKKINTDVLVGESSVGLVMKDLIQRTKNSIFVLMPQPHIPSIMEIIKLYKARSRLRVTVVGDLEGTPTSIMNKLLQTPTKVMQYDDIDFWAMIRDSEELLFAPMKTSANEEMTGLISQDNGLVNLISSQIQSFKLKAKKVN